MSDLTTGYGHSGRTKLAMDYSISPIITGCWQLSGGHRPGAIDKKSVFVEMKQLVEAGFSTFDCADIYTGVEELIGEFSSQYDDVIKASPAGGIQVHTKFVPDIDILAKISKAYVEKIIDRSLARLRVERLDLVQYYWWDRDVPGYMETAGWLADLQKAGKIRCLGVTNFDVAALSELLDSGVRVLCNQVQYSLLDNRPENGMVDFCRLHNVKLLCYGTLAGGFLSSRYLGQICPTPPFANRSLEKYLLIIDDFGGWDLFQELLQALDSIAKKNAVSLSTVAGCYILEKTMVGAVIIGMSRSAYVAGRRQIMAFRLPEDDRAQIDRVLDRRRGPQGDIYSLEKIKDGVHASIMRTGLNRE